MAFILKNTDKFKITIEVVPPEGHNGALLNTLKKMAHLPFDGFSVASNPIAKPRMSAMVFSYLLQQAIGKPAILHLTIRDHNAIGLQGEMWGARALGVETVIAMTGDPTKSQSKKATTVGDVNVFGLIKMSRNSSLTTGAVLDYRPETDGLDMEARRLEKKVSAGAQFIVTQPVYDKETADSILNACDHLNVPVIMGILPLLSPRHARFLHHKVAGIAIPKKIMDEMETAPDPVGQGIAQAKDLLDMAKDRFHGACVMPPFDRFDILPKII
jgi:methylenetetrahydrofolate reductase (NADPH)